MLLLVVVVVVVVVALLLLLAMLNMCVRASLRQVIRVPIAHSGLHICTGAPKSCVRTHLEQPTDVLISRLFVQPRPLHSSWCMMSAVVIK